ncbi:metallophosphoesterase family protein [Pseudomonas syringae]|nr:metallophosphoesterase [Pseudomonas syringae]MCF5467527.1 hypothetical protein [Pseudomonas syringae]MCF5474144.1 hypothetical protein [Pseudomonas syringae]MCF5481126.1 hypothetical protein [Pseudomonas syringae]MCF5496104.1 hypothetical protein [Pseudomonas syringae]MCF5518525.1 hypothetical protein [Pseudomonas syringae]
MNIGVAVISDLHIGSGAKAKDFSLPGAGGGIVDNYISEFRNFVESEGLRANYLIVPGDITNSACKPEFELASERISQIASFLTVPESNILFCPGNHDVDWETIKALSSLNHPESQVIKAKYFNFNSAGSVFSRNLSSATGSFDESPYLAVWDFDDALICALNTSVFDGPDKKPHCGEVRPDQLLKIDAYLSSIGRTKKLKLFMFHHHPVQYLDDTFNQPDFSVMSNAVGLLDLLSKHEFDFVVHGHKHIPRFNMEIRDIGHPLNILCAGSFSAYLDNKYFESVGNRFHLVEFHDRCPISTYARGAVKTWTHFVGRGWMPSLRRPGAEHHQNFGAFLPRAQLVIKITAEFEKIFISAQFIKWADFVSNNPEFRYFTSETLRASLKEVAGSMGLILHEIDAFGLDKLVILKG